MKKEMLFTVLVTACVATTVFGMDQKKSPKINISQQKLVQKDFRLDFPCNFDVSNSANGNKKAKFTPQQQQMLERDCRMMNSFSF